MRFFTVESSNLSAVGYEPKTKTLGVMFSSGSLYFYLGVPERVWENFKAAESKGKFFSSTIKPAYEFFPIEDLQQIDLGEQAALQ